MTIKLTRKEITIQLANGTSEKVMAWVMADNTLAAHKVMSKWSITHVPTGYRVIAFGGNYNRIRPLLAEISDMVDWTISSVASLELTLINEGPNIRSIIQKYQ